MAPIRTSWTRLIRFVAAETGQVHLGQPVDPTLDVGRVAHEGKPIVAHEVLANPKLGALDAGAQLTQRTLTVSKLLMPFSREDVGMVRCLGLNYADHAAEANMKAPAAPILFYKPASSLIGPEAPIHIPTVAQPVQEHLPDYEVELTIVIGKPARDVSEAEALDYVIAYTVANDISFRFHQLNVSQWGFSKGFDDTNPIGPCLVASHAVPDPQNLKLKTVLNGEVMQDGTTADQIFSVRKTISFLSQGTTLEPGTIILTGTPKGVGFVRKPPVVLRGGDRVEVSIDGFGTLINDVVEDKPASAKL